MQRAAVRFLWPSTRSILFSLAILAVACGHKNAAVKPPAAPATTRRAVAPAPRKEQPGVVTITPPTPSASSVSLDKNLRGPLIRIGLTVSGEDLKISAAGEFVLVEKTPETPRRTLAGQVQVRLERPAASEGEIYRVQVAALASQEAAEKLGQQLSQRFSLPAVVHESTSTKTKQVRLGEFASRKEAQEFVAGPLAEAGYRDAFVVREVGEAVKGEPTLALRGADGLFRVSRAGYLFLPGSDASYLRLNGKPYRGTLDVSLDNNSRVVAVNELGMEEYLLGVVPAELSPVSYPEEAALAAQAIAARTYALKNMGRFRADGFDLTDDTQTQVYGGVSLEKSGSSGAVQKTYGIAIYYGDSLINAMYTSTCGGRTEDFSNVFGGPPVPYLKSVFCTVEGAAAEASEANVNGSHDLDQVILATDGTPANRELELAQVLGLITPSQMAPEIIAGASAAGELKSWIEKSRQLGSRSDQERTTPELDITSRAGFIRFAAERLFGARELEQRISEADANYYLNNFTDGASVPPSARHAIAYLVQRKLWQPYPDNSIRPNESIRRGDALVLLVRWILSIHPEVLKTGLSAEPNGEIAGENSKSTLAIKRGNRTEQLRLSQDLRLFKITGDRSTPVTQLHVIGNEKVTYHQKPNSEVDFLEIELSASGAASDRFSPVATWQSTIPRTAAAEKLRPLAPGIGELLDLKPSRLGESGRVVQLQIIGSRGSAIVNGYKARNALGLKDTLYTLTRSRADDGTIAGFTFDGRGWGHGVGLCQTGAVGMARAGRSSEEILKTYYTGIELRKIY
jgi:stage II sporulation protein D